MSLGLRNGRPVMGCSRCGKDTTLSETCVLSYCDLQTVSFVCQPCGEQLVARYQEKRAELMPAARYFDMLLARRTQLPVSEVLARPGRVIPPAPILTEEDVAAPKPPARRPAPRDPEPSQPQRYRPASTQRRPAPADD